MSIEELILVVDDEINGGQARQEEVVICLIGWMK